MREKGYPHYIIRVLKINTYIKVENTPVPSVPMVINYLLLSALLFGTSVTMLMGETVRELFYSPLRVAYLQTRSGRDTNKRVLFWSSRTAWGGALKCGSRRTRGEKKGRKSWPDGRPSGTAMPAAGPLGTVATEPLGRDGGVEGADGTWRASVRGRGAKE